MGHRLPDITGGRYGRLVVICESAIGRNGQIMYECRCDCGNVVAVCGSEMVRGRVKSCGCLRGIAGEVGDFSLLGRCFGKLVVIKKVENDRSSKALWECMCECGRTRTFAGNYLRSGKATNCGCLNKRASWGESIFIRRIFSSYEDGAKYSGLDFTLTMEEFKLLVTAECYYCGVEPSNVIKVKEHTYKYSGIDRVDNKVGYIISNVRSCCTRCNRAKGTMTEREFFELVERVARNFNYI